MTWYLPVPKINQSISPVLWVTVRGGVPFFLLEVVEAEVLPQKEFLQQATANKGKISLKVVGNCSIMRAEFVVTLILFQNAFNFLNSN